MCKLSIICCYNDKKIYNNTFFKSINIQNFKDYEVVAVDNSMGIFKSAAAALNYAIDRTSSDYLLIGHQDFAFMNADQLGIFYSYINRINENSLVGVAGAILDTHADFIYKLTGRNRKVISSLGKENINDIGMIEVETLDECCFGLRKQLWRKHKFNEHLCPYWDLYAVEMCLYARSVHGKCYVVPVRSVHESNGKLTNKFYQALLFLSRYYKSEYKKIITTCVVVNTKYPYIQYCKLLIVNWIRKMKYSFGTIFHK